MPTPGPASIFDNSLEKTNKKVRYVANSAPRLGQRTLRVISRTMLSLFAGLAGQLVTVNGPVGNR